MNRIGVLAVLTFALGLCVLGGSLYNSPDASVRVEIAYSSSHALSDSYFTNGTLTIDGVTVTYENTGVNQSGNIIVKNGGKLILSNAIFEFNQLTGFQYTLRVENKSEVILTNSTLLSRYQTNWFVTNSNVTLIASYAEQAFIRLSGSSNISLSSGSVTMVSLRGSSHLESVNSIINNLKMFDNSIASLNVNKLLRIDLANHADIELVSCVISKIVLSDITSSSIQDCDVESVHLWNSAYTNCSDSNLENIELYDSTTCDISSCDVGELIIRSLETQTLENLEISTLECNHYSTVMTSKCNITYALATFHSNLSLHECIVEEGYFVEWSVGEISQSVFSDLRIGSNSIWFLSKSNITYLESSSASQVEVFDCIIGYHYAWHFSGGSFSHVNCTIDRVVIYWDSLFSINGTTLRDTSIISRSIGAFHSCNFTNDLLIATSAKANFTGSEIFRLRIRESTNVYLWNCTFTWRVEPSFETTSITNIPTGYFDRWHPLENNSFNDVSYNITAINSTMSLEISIGRDIICQIYNTSFTWTYIFDRANVNLTNCELGDFYAYGNARLINCSAFSTSTSGISSGTMEYCQFGTWNLYGSSSWVAKFSNGSHVNVAGWDGSFLRFESSTSNSLWISGTGEAEIVSSRIWQVRTYEYTVVTVENSTVDIWYNGAFTDHIVMHAYNCTFGTLSANAYVTIIAENCTIGYYAMSGYALATITNCSFNQFILMVDSQADVIGNFVFDYYSIRDNAEVTRQFSISVQFLNGTNCIDAVFEIQNITNQVLHSGTTDSYGRATFSLAFDIMNGHEFDDQYHVEVDITTYEGSTWFNVTTGQPIIVILTESFGGSAPVEAKPITEIALMILTDSDRSITMIAFVGVVTVIMLVKRDIQRMVNMK